MAPAEGAVPRGALRIGPLGVLQVKVWGAERPCRWSRDERVGLIEAQKLLFTWRRQARQGLDSEAVSALDPWEITSARRLRHRRARRSRLGRVQRLGLSRSSLAAVVACPLIADTKALQRVLKLLRPRYSRSGRHQGLDRHGPRRHATGHVGPRVHGSGELEARPHADDLYIFRGSSRQSSQDPPAR